MGVLKYPQKKEIKGPWLISYEKLEELAQIVESIEEKLERSWIEQLRIEIHNKYEELTEEEFSNKLEQTKSDPWYNRHESTCQLIGFDETRLIDKSMSNLLIDGAINSLKPKAINISISYGRLSENKFELNVSNLYEGELKYEVECFEPKAKDEIQYQIERWIDKQKPSRVLQFWSEYGGIPIYFLWLPIIILSINITTTSYKSYDEILKEKSNEIIDQGIDSTNINQAVELLIKMQSDFEPDNFEKIEKPKDPNDIKYLVLVIFITIVSQIRPKTVVGIGKRKRLLEFYKFWIKFVLVTLPTAMIIAPFWKFIVGWIY
ncbi:hypothetical protein [Ekhidna sp.]